MKLVKSMIVASVLAMAVPAAFAQRGHDGMGSMGSSSSGGMMQGGGMGMMNMDQARDRLQSMQQLMDRIHGTTDPQQRRKLLQEHMTQMQQFMGNMQGMMGQGMGGMSAEERQQWMGQRLDIMQQMMEQMIEQQSQMMK